MYEWLVLSETHSPVRKKRYKKAILKTGDFVKENPDGDDQEFSLTGEHLDAMASTYSQMVKDGHRIPIPLGHTDKEDQNRGYVEAITREGDFLFMEAEAIGDQAIEQFEQSDCSCFIPPKWKDSEGHEYIRPIRHVALTQYPVIPGLGKFEAIAASLVQTRKDRTMKFDKIQAALSLSEEMTEDNAETLILAGIGQLKEKSAPADPLAAAKEAVKMAPGILTTAKTGRETKLAALVLANKISPAVKDKLLGMFTTEDSLLLSLTSEGDDTEFDTLVAILSENKVVDTGEQTGAQPLGDKNKGGENILLAQAKARAEAARA